MRGGCVVTKSLGSEAGQAWRLQNFPACGPGQFQSTCLPLKPTSLGHQRALTKAAPCPVPGTQEGKIHVSHWSLSEVIQREETIPCRSPWVQIQHCPLDNRALNQWLGVSEAVFSHLHCWPLRFSVHTGQASGPGPGPARVVSRHWVISGLQLGWMGWASTAPSLDAAPCHLLAPGTPPRLARPCLQLRACVEQCLSCGHPHAPCLPWEEICSLTMRPFFKNFYLGLQISFTKKKVSC